MSNSSDLGNCPLPNVRFYPKAGEDIEAIAFESIEHLCCIDIKVVEANLYKAVVLYVLHKSLAEESLVLISFYDEDRDN